MSVSKRKLTKLNGLVFSAKIKYLDGKVTNRRSHSKRKIYNFLPKDPTGINWIYINVTYKPGIYNDGKYLSNQLDEMMNAWLIFTEEDLIKDALTY